MIQLMKLGTIKGQFFMKNQYSGRIFVLDYVSARNNVKDTKLNTKILNKALNQAVIRLGSLIIMSTDIKDEMNNPSPTRECQKKKKKKS